MEPAQATALIALIAIAQPQAKDDAKTAFERGLAHFDGLRYREAIEEFKRSLAIRQTAAVWYNLALTYYRLGEYDGALSALDHHRALGEAAGGDDRGAEEAAGADRDLGARSGDEDRPRREGSEAWGDLRDARPAPAGGAPSSLRDDHQKRAPGSGSSAGSLDLSPSKLLPARIVLRVDPNDAELSIDGAIVGIGEYRGEVAAGSHEIAAKKIEHLSKSETVELVAGEEKVVTLVLAVEAKDPFYATWWFWTITGVAVVGAAVAIGVAARPRYDGGIDGRTIEALHP
jgi:hypothetical protein